MRSLHDAQPRIGRRHRQKFNVLARLFGDGHHMREQILLGGGKDLIGLQVVLARSRRGHPVYRQDDDIHLARIGLLEHLFEMLQMERITAGNQNIAGPRFDLPLGDFFAFIETELLQILALARVFDPVHPLGDA